MIEEGFRDCPFDSEGFVLNRLIGLLKARFHDVENRRLGRRLEVFRNYRDFNSCFYPITGIHKYDDLS